MPTYTLGNYDNDSVFITTTISTYAATNDVADMCRSLLGNEQPDFDAYTIPCASAVVNWLGDGYAIINAQLAALGYTTPVASTVGLYQHLKQLDSLYAAGFAELARVNVTVGPGERTRGQVYLDMFWKQCNNLATYIGGGGGGGASSLVPDSTVAGRIYVGGTSVADHDANEDDTDRIAPRFTRDMFKF
jgi:hypothetical protein